MADPAITYSSGGVEQLDLVGPLWEALNEHHRSRSTHFAEFFAGNSFAPRRAQLEAKAGRGHLLVDLAKFADGTPVAYCVSSIEGELGEVESIYVAPNLRGRGIGDTFMKRALAWMDEHAVRVRSVAVVAGNEAAFGFYARYGFHPSYTMLRRR